MSKEYKPTKAFVDFDPIVYRAGYASQKIDYIYKDRDEVISPIFPSAREATVWKQNLEEFDEDTTSWTRESIVNYLSEDQALKKFEDIVKEYKKMAGSTITQFRGYLTSTEGTKHKVMPGIEHQYQKKREGSEKPKYFDLLREYAESRDYIKVCPEGYEADEILIYNAEKHGRDGVVMSIDKDMCTAENAWVIHVQKDGSGKPVWNTELGHLDIVKKGKQLKGVGGGFKFLAFQAIQGDPSDGYYGCKGIGTKKAVDLIKDLESKPAIVEACAELYERVYGPSYTYESWDGETITKTPLEMLQQHFIMPYMYRGSKDTGINIMDYL